MYLNEKKSVEVFIKLKLEKYKPYVINISSTWWYGGARGRSWLRHYATNRNVAGSIPDGVIGIFPWHNRFGRNMALRWTQPLTEMSTRNISWGEKAAGA
jgi:hypothetical protein